MHVHFRQGDMLKTVVPYTARMFAGALVMPNTDPPITTIEQVVAYKREIMGAIGNEVFEPYMTLFLQSDFSYEFLEAAKNHILAVKMYPKSMTTNSKLGMNPYGHDWHPVLSYLEDLDIPLCVHGETPGFVLDRENKFPYQVMAIRYPKLRIIMEHITTERCVALLDTYDNLHATITVHHLFYTLDHLIGGLMKPHSFCKPIPKREEDRQALCHLVESGHPKVMLGTDSAPHSVSSKECSDCVAGVFSAPVALRLLRKRFKVNLEAFCRDNAKQIYGIDPPHKMVDVKQVQVPQKIGTIVPWIAGGSV